LLGLNPDGQYLLFFGMIRKYKGLDLLLDAFHKVHQSNPEIQLIIAGEYYEDESIYQNKINEFISINKYIPDEEVHLYFSAADLITQTYHTATQSGISQIAYHYEKPMLVTDVGGLNEIVPHQKAGYVVPKNADIIATSIIDFFENNRAKEFLPHLKEEKKKYSWSNFVRLEGKLMLCGNGGSTCDALHIAEELTGKYKLERPPLAAIALAEAAHITCTANDYGFDAVFLRAIQALGKSGDCLLALSTSGNSKNVIEAAKYAKANQIFVVALTGLSGGDLKNHADIWINVPSEVTAHIQEAHITIGHLIIENVEQALFKKS